MIKVKQQQEENKKASVVYIVEKFNSNYITRDCKLEVD